jgi:hypothetical protein
MPPALSFILLTAALVLVAAVESNGGKGRGVR